MMVDFTAYQDVECVYPMSGQYGRAPRALYYALLIFVILLRRQDWLAAGAAAACLTYGGSAAIHAMILAPILSLGKTEVPKGVVQLSNSTWVKVEAALVTDLDSDATLAIVGAGFLMVMPMAIWSTQFRHSGAVPILVMWIVLIFIGMVCCMTVLYAVDPSSTGPLRQIRFCSLGYNDSLPFNGNSINVLGDSWNDTVWSYFGNQDPSSPSCLYPCLNASHILRQARDARVIEFLDINPSKPIYWGIELVSAIVYGCVPLSMAFSLALLVLRLRGYASTGWDFDSSETTGWRLKFSHYTLWAINVYGKILTPFVFVAFLIWSEWVISYDLQSEPMQLVGQWAPLVGAGLVFVAAAVGRYWLEFPRLWRIYQQRRIKVRSHLMDESAYGSLKYAWENRTKSISNGAWGQEAGFTFLQGCDMD